MFNACSVGIVAKARNLRDFLRSEAFFGIASEFNPKSCSGFVMVELLSRVLTRFGSRKEKRLSTIIDQVETLG
jgi:hypothetical protein